MGPRPPTTNNLAATVKRVSVYLHPLKAKVWLILSLAISLGVGAASLIAPTPAAPPARCTIEIGNPGCPPTTFWDSHLCRCRKVVGSR